MPRIHNRAYGMVSRVEANRPSSAHRKNGCLLIREGGSHRSISIPPLSARVRFHDTAKSRIRRRYAYANNSAYPTRFAEIAQNIYHSRSFPNADLPQTD